MTLQRHWQIILSSQNLEQKDNSCKPKTKLKSSFETRHIFKKASNFEFITISHYESKHYFIVTFPNKPYDELLLIISASL